MCGLLGVVKRTGAADWARAETALAKIAHRGPDGQGMVSITAQGNVAPHTQGDTRVLLGFRRLSILDLSHSADQPMRCPHTGNVLVFNGEIYNFLELREALETLGHRFTTSGDTEVILAAYAQWGAEAFARFNGMWGIALYDAASGDVLLCRDRMGVKPLYVAQESEQVLFASEIRAVIHLLGRMPAVRASAAFDFLAGIEIDHEDATLFDGILCVPAGSLWRIGRDGIITRRRYHDWPTGTDTTHTPEQLRELFTDSVRLRLRSDAPTISLLSGGLDSSITTWVAATQNRATPRTKFVGAFSYGYDDPRYAAHDETAQAAALIAALPEPITHTVVRMNPIPTVEELLALTVAQELPSTTPSIVASWRLYQHIRAAGIKVAISGEGADELFGGYTRRYMPLLARQRLGQLRVAEVAQLLRSPHLNAGTLINRLAWNMPAFALRPMLRALRPNVATLTAAFWESQPQQFEAIIGQNRESIDTRLRQDVVRTAMGQILRYADRNSMGASVEVRLPFMDYRVVEFALTTARAAKINTHGGKQILREAFRTILPDAVVTQPKTHGFGNAEQFQVRHLPLGPLLERAPAEAWDYIDRATLTRELAKPDTHPMLWLPISFLLWMTARHENLF